MTQVALGGSEGFENKHPDNLYIMGPTAIGKYTNSRAGQDIYKGLTSEGMQRFKELCKMCADARATNEAREKEQRFLKMLREELGVTAATPDEHNQKKARNLHHPDDTEEPTRIHENPEDAFDCVI